MNAMKKQLIHVRLFVVVLACCAAMTFSLSTTPSAYATGHVAQSSYLGGLNLRNYCQSLGYSSVRTVGTTYYDWRCVDGNGNDHAFSMAGACHWQYHIFNSVDMTYNFYTPTGGFCVKVANYLGGINFSAYCLTHGYTEARLVGSTAYDWRCYSEFPPSGYPQYSAVDTYDACYWMYHNSFVWDRFGNFYDAGSWECWQAQA
jgi:hypothetical protein